LILSVSAYRNHLVWMERENGLPRIVIRDRTSGEEHAIAFDEEAYSLGFQGSMEYDTDIVRFSYSSMTTPSELYDYNMTTRERTLLKRDEVPSGHNPGDYVTRRVMAPADDGEMVPVTLLYRQDTTAGRQRAVPALRLRVLRDFDPRGLQHQLPFPG
jgi:oligopeptidase B